MNCHNLWICNFLSFYSRWAPRQRWERCLFLDLLYLKAFLSVPYDCDCYHVTMWFSIFMFFKIFTIYDCDYLWAFYCGLCTLYHVIENLNMWLSIVMVNFFYHVIFLPCGCEVFIVVFVSCGHCTIIVIMMFKLWSLYRLTEGFQNSSELENRKQINFNVFIDIEPIHFKSINVAYISVEVLLKPHFCLCLFNFVARPVERDWRAREWPGPLGKCSKDGAFGFQIGLQNP